MLSLHVHVVSVAVEMCVCVCVWVRKVIKSRCLVYTGYYTHEAV